jgi:hypothetical protein
MDRHYRARKAGADYRNIEMHFVLRHNILIR